MHTSILSRSTLTDHDIDRIGLLIDQLKPKYPPVITRSYLESCLSQPGNTIFIARDDNGLLCGMLVLITLMAVSGNKVWIEDMVVDESYRGSGMGHSLISVCLEWAKHNNVTHINLTTRSTRVGANELYSSAGFKLHDTNYYRLTLA